jgi:hypothetical protein
LEEEHRVECQANGDYEAYRSRGVMKDGRRFGRPPNPFQPPAAPEGKINLTDLDSRNVKTSRGWVQGFNAQAVVTAEQIVIAAEVTVDSPDFGHLEPMVSATRSELERAGLAQRPEVVLADAGYWHQQQLERIVSDGLAVLVPPEQRPRQPPSPRPRSGGHRARHLARAGAPGGGGRARAAAPRSEPGRHPRAARAPGLRGGARDGRARGLLGVEPEPTPA